MSLKQTIKDYLEIEPKFRERRNKDRGITNLLLKRHPKLQNALQERFLTKDDIVSICDEFASFDRLWRLALMENPKLRGADYEDKDHLEQEKMSEMGYHTDRIGPGEAVEENMQPTLL